jgi:hypothetical protein
MSNWCVRKVQKWRQIGLAHSDVRVKSVSQFLSGVRVVKMYGWGEAQKVRERGSELLLSIS